MKRAVDLGPESTSPRTISPTHAASLTGFIGQVQDEVGVAVPCPSLDAGQQVDHGTARVAQQRLILPVLDDDEHDAAPAAAAAVAALRLLLLSSLLPLAVMALLLAVGLQHPRSHPHPPHDTMTHEYVGALKNS